MSVLKMLSSRVVRAIHAPIRPVQRWCHSAGNPSQNAGGNFSIIRLIGGSIIGWFAPIWVILWHTDRMRYKRTVNAFYDNFERAPPVLIKRDDEEKGIKAAIKNGDSMSIFYGPNSVGKSFLMQSACSDITEPVFYLEIENAEQFLLEFGEQLKYYGDEEVTLSNYFKWINPVFALRTKPKRDPTLQRVLIHLAKCQKWLKRAQNYPWNKAFGRYQGNLNIVLDSFDRLISLDPSSNQQTVDESRKMAQSLIQCGKKGIDRKGIRFNFVCSEKTLQLTNFSFIAFAGKGASKRMTIYEIEEIVESEAIKYLKGRKLSENKAKEAYKICGGLFDDMNLMIREKGDVEAFKAKLYREFAARFFEIGLFISPNDEKLTGSKLAAWTVLKQVVDSKDKQIDCNAYVRSVGDDQQLLDVLSGKKGPLFRTLGEYPSYKFTSTPMANYVKKVIKECQPLLS